jgi:hypothetical protein
MIDWYRHFYPSSQSLQTKEAEWQPKIAILPSLGRGSCLSLRSDKKSAEAVRHAFEQGGDRALSEWVLSHELDRARTKYVSPVSLAFVLCPAHT